MFAKVLHSDKSLDGYHYSISKYRFVAHQFLFLFLYIYLLPYPLGILVSYLFYNPHFQHGHNFKWRHSIQGHLHVFLIQVYCEHIYNISCSLFHEEDDLLCCILKSHLKTQIMDLIY